MTKEEKLLRAIGEIDEELIKDAASPYKKRFTPLTRGLTVAASIAVTSAILIASSGLLSPKFDNAMGGDAAPEVNDSASPGKDSYSTYIESAIGYIYDVREVDTGKISFGLLLYSDTDTRLNVNVFANDAQGNTRLVATNDIDSENYTPKLSPTLTVNLEPCDTLPQKGGNYFITIDFSKILGDENPDFSYIEIVGFGKIFEKPI